MVDLDLSKFFDRIHRDRLLAGMGRALPDKRILRLVGLILRRGIMANGLVTLATEGAVQGNPLSPWLSNMVLDELDKELERRGLDFCRFADACNSFVKTPRAAERVMLRISGYLEKRQWGWGGFTTQDVHRCQLIARAGALAYNGCSLFVRLAHPEARLEAITSRPLLLTGIAKRRAKDAPYTARAPDHHAYP